MSSSALPSPVFALDDADRPAARRLLLVSYHFPPDRAIGARRWEKLVHTAAERGYAVDVIMRDQAITSADAKRLDALPRGIRIFQVPTPTLAMERIEQRAADVLRSLRSLGSRQSAGGTASSAATSQAMPPATLPTTPPASSAASPLSIAREDIRWELTRPRGWARLHWARLDFARGAAWGKGVVRLAEALGREQAARGASSAKAYAAVISSGPPHMIHDTGRRVAEAVGAPFVMDMRDPWSCVERLQESVASPYWLHGATRYERRAVRRAALVVANTDVAREALQATYPERTSDIITVMNGADDDPLPPSVHADRFSIAHAGAIYLDRDPRPLFRAAAQLVRERGLTPAQFGLDFVGDFSEPGSYPLEAVAREEGIENFVTVGSSLPHAKAMEFMAGATMLVAMSGGNVAAIPAKTFECVRFEAWLLALTVPGSATERVLQGTGADVAAPDDTAAIAAILRRRYAEHASGVRPPQIGADGRFSRRRQAALLFDALEMALEARVAPAR